MTSFSKLGSTVLFIAATAVATALPTVVKSTSLDLTGDEAKGTSAVQQIAYRAAGRFSGFAFYRGSEHGRKVDAVAYRGSEHGRKVDAVAYRGSEHGRKFDSVAFYRASEHGAG